MSLPVSINTVQEALARIDAFHGAPSEFTLPIHKSLLDHFGTNMALITDRALAKGWEPDGFIESGDCRVFRYKVRA